MPNVSIAGVFLFDFFEAIFLLLLYVQICKTFFGGNLDFPKIRKLNKVCSTA